jgi:nucleotide-binding universal stress UspA family protein
MSASRSKKERQSMAGLSEKEKKAALEAKAQKRKHILYGVLGGVAAVAIIALLIWDNGVVQRHLTAYTIGDHKYTAADLDYFYYSEYNSYYSTYVSYGIIDSDTDLKEQVYSQDEDGNDITWHDLFVEDAISSLTSMTVLYDEAVANGYTISEDGAASVQSTLDSIETACTTYSVTKAYYLEYLYGPYMTEKRLENLLTMTTIASEYSELIYDNYEDAVTEDEVSAYYDENSDSLDTYSYYVYYVSGSAASTTDEDGNTVSPTDEESEAAMTAASELADQLVAAIADGDDVTVANLVGDEDNSISDYGSYTNVGSSVSTNYSEWLMDESREVGDVSAQEGLSGYYVVRFDGRSLEERYPATYRDILITAETDEDAEAPTEEQLADAQAKAEDLMGQVTDEQSFIDLVADNSSSSTSSSEGLNSSVSWSGVSDANVQAWLFDENHNEGDLGLVEAADGTGYYVLYFSAYDEQLVWQQTATSSLATDAYNDWYDGVSADITGVSGIGYGLVG